MAERVSQRRATPRTCLKGLCLGSELMEARFSFQGSSATQTVVQEQTVSSRQQTAESVLLQTRLHVASEECDRFFFFFCSKSCIVHIIKDVSGLVPYHARVPYHAKGTVTSPSPSPSPQPVTFLNLILLRARAHLSVHTAATAGAQLL